MSDTEEVRHLTINKTLRVYVHFSFARCHSKIGRGHRGVVVVYVMMFKGVVQ